MPLLRVVIDTDIFDALACDPDTFAAVIGLQKRGAIQLLITHLQESQIAKAPPFIRKTVKALNPDIVGTHGAMWDVSRGDKVKHADKLAERKSTRIQGKKAIHSRALVGKLDFGDGNAWRRCLRHQPQGCWKDRETHCEEKWSKAAGLGVCRVGRAHRAASRSGHLGSLISQRPLLGSWPVLAQGGGIVPVAISSSLPAPSSSRAVASPLRWPSRKKSDGGSSLK